MSVYITGRSNYPDANKEPGSYGMTAFYRYQRAYQEEGLTLRDINLRYSPESPVNDDGYLVTEKTHELVKNLGMFSKAIVASSDMNNDGKLDRYELLYGDRHSMLHFNGDPDLTNMFLRTVGQNGFVTPERLTAYWLYRDYTDNGQIDGVLTPKGQSMIWYEMEENPSGVKAKIDHILEDDTLKVRENLAATASRSSPASTGH